MPQHLTAIILAGGLGTRLRTVIETPKPIVPVRGRPYLFYLLEALKYEGVRRAVICTGYRSEAVIEALEKWNPGLSLSFSTEAEPLGTAGALRHAAGLVKSEFALVLNGDSFCDFNLAALCQAHGRFPDKVSMVAVEVDNCGAYGRLTLDAEGRVLRFAEKDGLKEKGWINAGIYLLPVAKLRGLPERTPLSLEKEVFPGWLEEGIFAFPTQKPFLDIGTPESFAQREVFIDNLRSARQTRVMQMMFAPKRPSSDTQIKTGVGVLVRNDRRELLLEKRSDCGLWGLPGGAVESGESITETARREMLEETGLEVEIEGLFGVYSEPEERILVYPDNGDVRQLIDIVVLARAVSGELTLSPESDELRYFSFQMLPPSEMIIPPARAPLRDWGAGRHSVLF